MQRYPSLGRLPSFSCSQCRFRGLNYSTADSCLPGEQKRQHNGMERKRQDNSNVTRRFYGNNNDRRKLTEQEANAEAEHDNSRNADLPVQRPESTVNRSNGSRNTPDEMSESKSPRSRSDWKFLPPWRRQNLSINYKLQKSTPFQRHPTATDSFSDLPLTSTRKVPWSPRKKISPDAMVGLKTLHVQDPDQFTIPKLSGLFKLSPDAVRRILKSKWQPNEEEAKRRDERWKRRGREVVEKYKEQAGLERTQDTSHASAEDSKQRQNLYPLGMSTPGTD